MGCRGKFNAASDVTHSSGMSWTMMAMITVTFPVYIQCLMLITDMITDICCVHSSSLMIVTIIVSFMLLVSVRSVSFSFMSVTSLLSGNWDATDDFHKSGFFASYPVCFACNIRKYFTRNRKPMPSILLIKETKKEAKKMLIPTYRFLSKQMKAGQPYWIFICCSYSGLLCFFGVASYRWLIPLRYCANSSASLLEG